MTIELTVGRNPSHSELPPADNAVLVSPPISVMICDDHVVLGDSLAALVRSDPRLNLLAEPFDRAAPAIAAAGQLAPDVVLIDVALPDGISGIDATRAILDCSPCTKVVVMSGSADPDEMLVAAVEAGAAGFLSKTEPAEKILAAVRAAAIGDSLIDSATLGWVLRRMSQVRIERRADDEMASQLTSREVEVLQRLANGESNADIAASLFLSVHTVHTHVRNILGKLGFHSKLQAVAWAAKSGVVTMAANESQSLRACR